MGFVAIYTQLHLDVSNFCGFLWANFKTGTFTTALRAWIREKTPLEKEADKILRDDTQRRGSGMGVRSPRPAREVLIADFNVLAEQAASWDEYPSDAEFGVEENARSRMLKALCDRLLTDRQAAALDLVVMRGWSYGDAAAEMNLAKGTVQTTSKLLLAAAESMEDNPTAALLFPELGG